MLRLFKRYLKPYRWFIVAAVVLVFVQVFASLKLPDIMSDIVDTGIVNGDIPYILERGLVMLLWALCSMAAVVGASYVVSRVAMGYGRDVRSDLFSKVESFSVDTLNRFGASSLITRNTNDVQQNERFVIMLLSMALMTPLMFIGAIIMSFMKSVTISLVVLGALPVLGIVLFFVLRVAMPLLRSLQKKIDTLNRVSREGLTGIRVIRAYNKEAFEEARFARANRDLSDTNMRIGRTMAAMMPAVMLVMNAVTLLALWFGSSLIGDRMMEVGDLMAIIQYASMVLISAMMLSMIFMLLPRTIAASERILEVLDTVEPIDNPAEACAPEASAAKGAICFNDVSFTFDGAEEPTLKNLNFTVESGSTIAIIGSTGSGKSTVANLMLRFSDPTTGSITLDGIDLRAFNLEDLRSRLSFVPQKASLFSGTIKSNICYSNKDASEEDIARASRIAHVDEFAKALEDGLDAQVSQGGTNLSGGQRQRVAIARALARDAEVYIFDDSFSALDLRTDAFVREAIRREMNDKTMVIVAQRINIAIDADMVIVLDNGTIAGIGTHAQLAQSCDVYREIALSQLSEEELEQSVASGSTPLLDAFAKEREQAQQTSSLTKGGE